MRNFFAVSTLALISVCVAASFAQAPAPAQPAADPRLILQKLGTAELPVANAPGFVLGMQDTAGRHIAAFGVADESGKAPLTPGTRFAIGSISKQFTAAAILLLVEDGKLSLETSISRYTPAVPNSSRITVRMLLNQTSGLHNYPLLSEHPWPTTGVIQVPELVATVATDKPDFEPGTRFAYSNTNYLLLAAILQQVSGMSYADLLRDRIFIPLGMASTGAGFAAQQAATIPYAGQHGSFHRQKPNSLDLFTGAGSIVSTAADLLRWDAALMDGKLLKPDSLRLFWSTGRAADGSATQYAMGWVPGRVAGHRELWHNGFSPGAGGYCWNAVFPDDKLAIVVLSNGSDFRGEPERLTRELVSALLPAAAQGPAPDASAAPNVSPAATPAVDPAPVVPASAATPAPAATPDRAATPAPTATPDPDPQAAALALKVLAQLQSGKLDSALYTPQMLAVLTPEKLAQGSAALSTLGTPTLTLSSRQEHPKGTAYVFTASSGPTTLKVRMFLTTDGKVGGFFLAP